MNEKTSLAAVIGIIILMIAIVGFFAVGYETIELYDVLFMSVPIVLVFGVVIFLYDRLKNLRAGLPNQDERAKKLHWKAGAYAYIATIWIAIGTMWYNIIFADNLGYPELSAGQVVGVIVLLSAIVWFSFQLYFQKKGDTE